jgi:ribosomal protein L11 methyltransferase
MDWLEITVKTTPEKLDALVSRLEDLGVNGLVINDEASIREFLDNNPQSWDYVDDAVFSQVRGNTSLQFYLEDSAAGLEVLAEYRTQMPGETFEVKSVRDEDWQNNWKNFFKPIEVGSRLLIVPEWEPIPENTGRIILRIEPKLVFGTGSHASTRMCLEELENHNARNVLDLGCGSGILAVAALLYGAENAVGCDIAPDAAAVCLENALANGLDGSRLKIFTGNVLIGNTLFDIAGGSRYDIVLANIIADVIIPLSPHISSLLSPGGVFICSGIIDGRQDEVRSALIKSGLEVIRERQADNWHMFAARAAAAKEGG